MAFTINKHMKNFSSFLLLTIFFFANANAQSPAIYSSADILQQIKKLEVFGSVLYIAAHPDDENTRLLGYLANERKFRTGYLSLTRGDGGQNLIGDEQGIDLGLIRTQELLSARRVDGAEQFFTRAFDFGYSKNPEEAMKIWDHDKIFADVVWTIRKFKPDVIITRFPTTGEGGHGHHTASAILAGEAYDAAADATKFPEQLKYVTTWQAKRLLWNTFNFGGNSTQREDQFKIDCGVYNPILGKSYGEIAAESRSRHKSQGFGVPAQRGKNIEYFATIKGDKPLNDLMDGIDITSKRIGKDFSASFNDIKNNYSFENPANSLKQLTNLYKAFKKMDNVYWKELKLKQLITIIEKASGIFLEATSVEQLIAIGDSMKLNFVVNNRMGIDIKNVDMHMGDTYYIFKIDKNENSNFSATIFTPQKTSVTQPYWLESPKDIGSFNIADQTLIGKAENDMATVDFSFTIDSTLIEIKKPIMYKYTDPVKGELYEPVQIVSPAFVNVMPNLLIFSSNKKNEKKPINFTIQSNLPLNEKVKFYTLQNKESKLISDTTLHIAKTGKAVISTTLNGNDFTNDATTSVGGELAAQSMFEHQYTSLKKISYDHIPDIFYNYQDKIKVLKIDLKTVGSKAGYIVGAGDKVPQALEQMGYTVTMLSEKDITASNLKQFDVVITGVRAYNIHAWLSNVHPILMQYVKDGGVLLTQYNTNNQLGPVKASMAPYPFTISRNRITDETAVVNFLLPNHPALNYPNKITEKDFDGWIQERSIYNAEKIDSSYKKVLSMKDPGETEQDGSLIVADYGKGKYVYTGLVFFRELPAGVGGAYRLFANLIARRKL
jgi:LmbE family N-acetylglucosaminyl deacetylase